LKDRLLQLYESAGTKDLVEIALLALAIYLLLRLLGRTRGAGIVRGLGLIVFGLFLVAQVVIASFDLTVLGGVLDYLLTTVLVGLLVIFQPELRRGLMVLGRYRLVRLLGARPRNSMADTLANAAQAMSAEFVGALIAIEREMPLSPFVETGERLDSEVSSLLIRAVFSKRSPLHDGAMILCSGRIAAAACQLPLGQPPEGAHMGMRHRSALALSEETDAVLLVVSEESGRISIAVGGHLEAVPREHLTRRLTELLNSRGRALVRLRHRSRRAAA
jgi:diadenylate cyclase